MKYVLMLALIYACASKKPENKVDDSVAGDTNVERIEINGDSDHTSAGGLRTVHFGYDSSALSSSETEVLKKNAVYLKANPAVVIQVEGHCDERGGRQYNLALGEKRARTVKDLLRAHGVHKSRVKTISYGNEKPLMEGNDDSSWSKNRRANFVILAK